MLLDLLLVLANSTPAIRGKGEERVREGGQGVIILHLLSIKAQRSHFCTARPDGAHVIQYLCFDLNHLSSG